MTIISKYTKKNNKFQNLSQKAHDVYLNRDNQHFLTLGQLHNFSIKVCHSSAFQTILRRSVYIKIINHSDSISANLNNTMQTKQHAMKKPHSYSNRNKIYKGQFFVLEGFWAENVHNLQFLLIQ